MCSVCNIRGVEERIIPPRREEEYESRLKFIISYKIKNEKPPGKKCWYCYIDPVKNVGIVILNTNIDANDMGLRSLKIFVQDSRI